MPELLADARLASVGELIRRQRTADARDPAAFTALCDAVRDDNADLMRTIVRLAAEIVSAHRSVLGELARVRAVSEPAAADLAEQLGNLVFGGFLSATGYEHLVDLPRYLTRRADPGGQPAGPCRPETGARWPSSCVARTPTPSSATGSRGAGCPTSSTTSAGCSRNSGSACSRSRCGPRCRCRRSGC